MQEISDCSNIWREEPEQIVSFLQTKAGETTHLRWGKTALKLSNLSQKKFLVFNWTGWCRQWWPGCVWRGRRKRGMERPPGRRLLWPASLWWPPQKCRSSNLIISISLMVSKWKHHFSQTLVASQNFQTNAFVPNWQIVSKKMHQVPNKMWKKRLQSWFDHPVSETFQCNSDWHQDLNEKSIPKEM